uniref:Uncharacterized protein n=1 Tax=Trichinella nativa TaxID=6335 RepID=A0A0V1IQQ9_9BILA
MTPFTIVTNNIKYLGVTLTKQISEDGKISHAHGLAG